jgi:type-F conjugative transfer system pilin assembly protein TrbC
MINRFYLLFTLLTLLAPYSFASAETIEDIFNVDPSYSQSLLNSSKHTSLEIIRQKYLELQKMLGKNKSLTDEHFEGPDVNATLSSQPVLKVFVSSSMGIELLKAYVRESRRYNAVIIFKGIPDGSWKRLSALITDITEGKNSALQIDDEAFAKFKITSVPSFIFEESGDVLQSESAPKFDKVTGNIGIRSALQIFAKEGELKDPAEHLLLGREK